MVQSNLLMSFPVPLEDVERAEETYGPRIVVLKGNMVRSSTDKVNTDYIKVPMWVLDSNHNVTLVRYIMLIGNMIPLFVSISLCLNFTTVEHIQSRETSINILEAISHVN